MRWVWGTEHICIGAFHECAPKQLWTRIQPSQGFYRSEFTFHSTWKVAGHLHRKNLENKVLPGPAPDSEGASLYRLLPKNLQCLLQDPLLQPDPDISLHPRKNGYCTWPHTPARSKSEHHQLGLSFIHTHSITTNIRPQTTAY